MNGGDFSILTVANGTVNSIPSEKVELSKITSSASNWD
jgi:hypothetical protein